MYKIKLLILLLPSLLISCTTTHIQDNNLEFKLGYVGGEFNGLILSNLLESNLSSLGLKNEKSNYEIEASIDHSSSVYITNIDNTSDREKIVSQLTVKVLNKKDECVAYQYKESISQFYIYASNEKFISNQQATEEIKFNNTEGLVREFVNQLAYAEISCDKYE